MLTSPGPPVALIAHRPCTCTCTCTRTQARMHACTHARIRMHACTHARMHACTHAHMHACTHARMHTCTHARMHTCTHAHTQDEHRMAKKLGSDEPASLRPYRQPLSFEGTEFEFEFNECAGPTASPVTSRPQPPAQPRHLPPTASSPAPSPPTHSQQPSPLRALMVAHSLHAQPRGRGPPCMAHWHDSRSLGAPQPQHAPQVAPCGIAPEG